MVFFGNSSAFRKNKLHFLSNPKFLTNVLTILDSKEYPLKVKAFTAHTLCVAMHNHQGVKAAWSKQVYEGINKIKFDLERYEEAEDDEIYGNLKFETDAERHSFLQSQSKYKQMCIDALTDLDIYK